MFGCLSSLFRHLVRQLAADLVAQLARTARLRYHRADHVRRLAARSAGFLFRHAGNKSLRAGVRAVFAGERHIFGTTADPGSCNLLGFFVFQPVGAKSPVF